MKTLFSKLHMEYCWMQWPVVLLSLDMLLPLINFNNHNIAVIDPKMLSAVVTF